MEQELIIDDRFNGPPDSGNGGYVCGLIANHIEGTAEVTLRKPPPLGRQLSLSQGPEGAVQLLDGQTLIAVGRPAGLEIETPLPPSLKQAKAAVPRYIGFQSHYFPTCFVCGPHRIPKDGLQIYPGQADDHPLGSQGLVTSPWVPTDDLSDENGQVCDEFVWAALDCPGAFAVMAVHSLPVILGRLTAAISQPVFSGQEYIVSGWAIGQEGRKYYAGTAVHTPDGQLCAVGKATWIAIK